MPQTNSNTTFVIRINNWRKYQKETKARRRGWVSISVDIINDPDFFELNLSQRYLWIMLICHAGRVGVEEELSDGSVRVVFKLRPSSARVLFKLRPSCRVVEDFRSLENKGLIELDTPTLHNRTIQNSTKHSIEQQAARTPKTANGYSPNFERFWAVYPNKKGKAKAFAAWSRQRLDDKADLLIENVQTRLRDDGQWIEDGGKYIPHGSTWIAGKRWEDDIRAATGDKFDDLKRELGV